MADAYRDQNNVPTLIASSNLDGKTPVRLFADPITHRLLVDLPGGSGTVMSVSVATANGLAGTVATATTTPVITLSTTVTGLLKGNGTAISAAVANTDYQSPISLTTTGTSGAATFIANTLNIPQYQASGTYVTSVTGTSNRITSSGGTTPVIDIAATYVGQTSITTLGTIATGVWNGTAVSPVYGGTGVSNNAAMTVTGTGAFAYNRTLTGATNVTFPTSGTLAISSAAQTFTGTQTFSQTILTANAIAASGNAATVPVTSGRNIVTNNSAATLTITLTTAGAVNMQTCIVQILDFSAVAQTLVFVNTENSTTSVPTTSNGSTTLPLTVGFIYNSATSKFRCVASS